MSFQPIRPATRARPLTGARLYLLVLVGYPLIFVALVAAFALAAAYARTNFSTAFQWILLSIVLGSLLTYGILTEVKRIRSAVLSKSIFQDRYPGLDEFRSLRGAWKEPNFRRGVALLVLFVISLLLFSSAMIYVIRLVKNAA